MAGAAAVSALGDKIRALYFTDPDLNEYEELANEVDTLEGEWRTACNDWNSLAHERGAQIDRVRALADMWASEVSSDEQDYIQAAKYRGVARDIYEALGDEN
jgi:hypothetical protein